MAMTIAFEAPQRYLSRGLLWLSVAFVIHLTPNVYCNCRNGELIGVGITDEDKLSILQTHNWLRSCVAVGRDLGDCKTIDYNQPTGKNIQELTWDDALAATAQKWANECSFAHDTVEHRFDPRFCVGQNVHSTKLPDPHNESSSADFPHAIKKWFLEQNDYRYNVHGNGTKKKTNHYTQLIWATSNLVGCGFAYYKDSREQFYKYKKLYVCNYGPCGNELKQYPYDHGRPACDQYNLSWSTYNGLCINSQFSQRQ